MSHQSLENLSQKIKEIKAKIKPNSLYFHYKNPQKHYQIISVGVLEENHQIVIIYKSLSKPQLVWIRSYENFCEKVKINDKELNRFTLIEQKT